MLYNHESVVYCIDLSLDGSYIVSASNDRKVGVYSLDSKSVVIFLSGHQSPVWCVKVSSKKNFIASGDQNGEILI